MPTRLRVQFGSSAQKVASIVKFGLFLCKKAKKSNKKTILFIDFTVKQVKIFMFKITITIMLGKHKVTFMYRNQLKFNI